MHCTQGQTGGLNYFGRPFSGFKVSGRGPDALLCFCAFPGAFCNLSNITFTILAAFPRYGGKILSEERTPGIVCSRRSFVDTLRRASLSSAKSLTVLTWN
jgi:hypothetical protein